MSNMLPRLFFTHFCETSFIAELEEIEIIVGFLIGFLSQTHTEEAYIHFAGVHPSYRQQGIGRKLYEIFFRTAQDFGRTQIKCVTSPINKNSISYHQKMGFKPEPSKTYEDGIPYHSNYDGIGEHRVLFVKYL